MKNIDFDLLEKQCKFNISSEEKQYILEKFDLMLNNAKVFDNLEMEFNYEFNEYDGN